MIDAAAGEIGRDLAYLINIIIAWPIVKIARARKAADILRKEQEPFWLTGGSIALSNLGITPPTGAQWWWTGRIAFVFVRSLAPRFSVDSLGHSLIWEDSLEANVVSRENRLTGQGAAGILQHLGVPPNESLACPKKAEESMQASPCDVRRASRVD